MITCNINCLREEIDEIDNQIVDLLAMRMETVKKIAAHKKKNNVSLFQPDRWNEIIKNRIKAGREKNLSEKFILNLYHFIHEESIRQQEKV